MEMRCFKPFQPFRADFLAQGHDPGCLLKNLGMIAPLHRLVQRREGSAEPIYSAIDLLHEDLSGGRERLLLSHQRTQDRRQARGRRAGFHGRQEFFAQRVVVGVVRRDGAHHHFPRGQGTLARNVRQSQGFRSHGSAGGRLQGPGDRARSHTQGVIRGQGGAARDTRGIVRHLADHGFQAARAAPPAGVGSASSFSTSSISPLRALTLAATSRS